MSAETMLHYTSFAQLRLFETPVIVPDDMYLCFNGQTLLEAGTWPLLHIPHGTTDIWLPAHAMCRIKKLIGSAQARPTNEPPLPDRTGRGYR